MARSTNAVLCILEGIFSYIQLFRSMCSYYIETIQERLHETGECCSLRGDRVVQSDLKPLGVYVCAITRIGEAVHHVVCISILKVSFCSLVPWIKSDIRLRVREVF